MVTKTIRCSKCNGQAMSSPAGVTVVCVRCWRTPVNCKCRGADDEVPSVLRNLLPNTRYWEEIALAQASIKDRYSDMFLRSSVRER